MKTRMRKFLAAALCLCLLSASLLTGCTGNESGTDTETDTQVPEATAPEATEAPTVGETDTEAPVTDAPTEAPTEAETEPEVKTPMIDFATLSSETDKNTTPFWLMNTMYNEATSFIVREDGTVTAKLLFKPTRLISVKSNDLTTEFVEGVDYTWDGTSNTLILKEGSSIPFFTQNDIHGKDENGNYIEPYPAWDALGRSRFGNSLYCVQAFLYEKQIAVTYEYEYGAWDGPVTAYQGQYLPKTMNLLQNDEEINIVFWGDSIFTGCDSSHMYNRAPDQVSFPDFTKEIVEQRTGLHVRRYNPSVGGMDSNWGVAEVQQVISKEPDLVFIGFGMNDGGKSGRQVAKNVQKIIDSIKAEYPNCEFVVVCCMVPNEEAGFLSTHTQFSKAFAELQTEGVAVVDMFKFHSKLLETKDFISMSGNNINHPNDWLIRCYTMNLMSAMFDYTK